MTQSNRISESSQPAARSKSNSQPKSEREPRTSSGSRIGLGVVIFVGSLLGSLIGTFAQINDIADSFARVQAAFYPELCVTGSDTILGAELEVAPLWAAAFEADHNVRITLDARGSGNGVQQAASGGCAHIIAMSEPISDSQIQTLTNANVTIDCAAVIGYDIVAFVTHIDNTVAFLDATRPANNNVKLREILLGEVQIWQDGIPLTIYARPGSGTTDVILRNIGNYPYSDLAGGLPADADPRAAFPSENYIACSSNGACLDATLSTPGALYWASLAWLRTQPERYLRVLPILAGDERPLNPLLELRAAADAGRRFNLDDYPRALTRPLYMYVVSRAETNAEAQTNARDFLNFVRGIHGQLIMEDHGFFTHFDPPANLESPLPAGFDTLTVCNSA